MRMIREVTNTVTNKFTFSFAKRYGVLVTHIENNTARVVYRHKPDLDILNELRRYFNVPLILETVDEETFSQLLVKHYETDTNTAMQMAEDLGESMDLLDL